MSDYIEEGAYFLRFVSMYIDLCTDAVLKTFIYHTPLKDAESFLVSQTTKLQELKRKNILNQQEFDLVYTTTPYPKAFDISLLITLAINLLPIQTLPPPVKGWSNPPKNSDLSVSADLLRLRKTRNIMVGHQAKAQLPKWRFVEEWGNVEKILIRLYKAVSPGEVSLLTDRIKEYHTRRLDPDIKNKHEPKLKDWYDQILKIQQQVEDNMKKLEDTDKYLKSTSDRYERYITLLVKGGRFVLSALNEVHLNKQNKSLKDILQEKEDFVRNKIVDQAHIKILYPSDQNSPTDDMDMSQWDIQLLATLYLEVLHNSSVERDISEAINHISNAQKCYAEAVLNSFNSDKFTDDSFDLKYSIKFLSRFLDVNSKTKCETILEDCKSGSKSSDEHKKYLNELKTQGMNIKTIYDIFAETMKDTKQLLQEMITCGISFKKEHVLELKMITMGDGEEKNQLGEEILVTVWQEALDRSGKSNDFDVVKREVSNILSEIRKNKHDTRVQVKQECIVLEIASNQPIVFMDLLVYFDSSEFNDNLRNISSELGYMCNTFYSIQSSVTLESLAELRFDREPERTFIGSHLAIRVKSPEDVMELRALVKKSESIVKETHAFDDTLSRDDEVKPIVEISHKINPVNSLFKKLEREETSSERMTGDNENEKVYKDSREQSNETKHELFLRQKIDLKNLLVKHYRTNFTTSDVTPLSDQDVPINDMFISPDVTASREFTDRYKYKVSFVSYIDTFQNILLTGAPGIGKTTFCKNIICSWCNGTLKTKKLIEFLFYIQLTENDMEKSLDTLIRENFNFLGEEIPEMVFEAESKQCLIIVDALEAVASSYLDMNRKADFSCLRHKKEYTLVYISQTWTHVMFDLEKLLGIQAHLNINCPEFDQVLKKVMARIFEGRLQFNQEVITHFFAQQALTTREIKLLLHFWSRLYNTPTSEVGVKSYLLNSILGLYLEQNSSDNLFRVVKEMPQTGFLSKREFCLQSMDMLLTLGGHIFLKELVRKRGSVMIPRSTLPTKQCELCLRTGLIYIDKDKRLYISEMFKDLFCAIYIVYNQDKALTLLYKKFTSVNDYIKMKGILSFCSGISQDCVAKMFDLIAGMSDEDSRFVAYREGRNEMCRNIEELQCLVLSCLKEVADHGLEQPDKCILKDIAPRELSNSYYLKCISTAEIKSISTVDPSKIDFVISQANNVQLLKIMPHSGRPNEKFNLRIDHKEKLKCLNVRNVNMCADRKVSMRSLKKLYLLNVALSNTLLIWLLTESKVLENAELKNIYLNDDEDYTDVHRYQYFKIKQTAQTAHENDTLESDESRELPTSSVCSLKLNKVSSILRHVCFRNLKVFHLQGFEISENILRNISANTALEKITIIRCSINTDLHIESPELQNIREITLSHMTLTHRQLTNILNTWPSKETLRLIYLTVLKDDGYENFDRMKTTVSCRDLIVENCNEITKYININVSSNLEQVYLVGLHVSGLFKHLGICNKLESVIVIGTEINIDCFLSLNYIAQLRYIILEGVYFEDDASFEMFLKLIPERNVTIALSYVRIKHGNISDVTKILEQSKTITVINIETGRKLAELAFIECLPTRRDYYSHDKHYLCAVLVKGSPNQELICNMKRLKCIYKKLTITSSFSSAFDADEHIFF